MRINFLLKLSILLVTLVTAAFPLGLVLAQVDLLDRETTEKPYEFGMYLGNDPDMLYRMWVFETVVLDTSQFTSEQLSWLNEQETEVFSYIPLSSNTQGSDGYRLFRDWRLHQVPHTSDRYYVDPSSAEWRTYVIQEVMQAEVEKGIDGFYLTDFSLYADVAEEDQPEAAQGFHLLLKQVHKNYPRKRVIVENPLSLFSSKYFSIKRNKAFFDGIAQTEVSFKPMYSADDNGRDTYVAQKKSKRKELFNKLKQFRHKDIYIIDFTNNSNQKTLASQRARNYGFTSFVGTRYLDTVLWYGGLTSSVSTRPFQNDSVWNTPISENAEVDDHSEQMIETLFNGFSQNRIFINVDEWTSPMYYVGSNTPQQTLSCVNCGPGVPAEVPIPDEAQADPTTDGLLSIIDVENGVAYDLYQANENEDGSWQSTSAFVFDLRGSGIQEISSTSTSTRGAGFPLAAGMIRRDELLQGVIPHALVMAIDYPKGGNFVWPASAEDGRSDEEYGIPEGARLRLDPDVDIESLELSRSGEIIATAMQDYGVFVSDNADGIAIYVEGRYGKTVEWEDEVTGEMLITSEDIAGIPLDALEVMELGELLTNPYLE